MAVVAVSELVKRYGDTRAVDGVSFEVARGELFALLGPNGAGKTTTVEILEGFRDRDGGSVDILGFDPGRRSRARAFREKLGVVLQELAVEPFLTVRQALTRAAGFYPHPKSPDEVVRLVSLADRASSRVRTLSGGQQRRLDLGLGIIGNPALLFLDEPTTGFDPSARREAWDVIRALKGEGTTVILTTHYMDEAEALAARVAVINAGRIVAQGTPATLGGRDRGDVRIRFTLPPGVERSDLPVQDLAVDGRRVEIRTDRAVEVLATLTPWARARGVDLPGLSVDRLDLEDVYLELIGNVRSPSGSLAP